MKKPHTIKHQQSDTAYFQKQLHAYQQRLNQEIQQYAKQARKQVLQSYGSNARLETDAYLAILERGGKRIRGSLTLLGYEMCGGKDSQMIIKAALAVEMMHAYILIIDDIQDHSQTRRGGPSAHQQLAQYHQQKQYAQDDYHFGISIAMNAALAGAHQATIELALLDAPQELKLKAISIMNRTMAVTAHGQTQDIMNEVVPHVELADIEKTLEWKTAHYTILNPLHVGMVLAGADCHATDAITTYALHTGKAFQVSDDILGIFGSEFASGKSPMDDIREGKRTVLTVHALQVASNGNKNFLLQMLGNHQLTQDQFERCKEIIIATGALEVAKDYVQQHVASALKALEIDQAPWLDDGGKFLRGLAVYLPNRET